MATNLVMASVYNKALERIDELEAELARIRPVYDAALALLKSPHTYDQHHVLIGAVWTVDDALMTALERIAAKAVTDDEILAGQDAAGED